MNIYISGISGTGMGPLALMAHQAGENVTGSSRRRRHQPRTQGS